MAALLRANDIPSGICYQLFTREDEDDSEGYINHALNTVYIEELDKWIRLDARGGSVVRKIIDKYGLINVIISLICCVVFILNCVFITKDSLININENIAVAWLLNFFAGCEGILGKWGSMSYTTAIEELQLWRLVTQAYLHSGIIHMAFNLAALLVTGKYVEKQLGTVKYLTVYHLIAIIDAVIIDCFLFKNSVFVGASGGIFGVIGIAFAMFLKKQLKFKKSEIVWLIIFVLIASVLGTETILLHAFGFVLGVISGFILIRKNDEKSVAND